MNPRENALRIVRFDAPERVVTGPLARQAAAWDRESTFLCGSHRDTLWEKSYMLAGMETMMIAFHTEPEAVREVLHRITNFHLGIAEHYVEFGVEMVSMSDDLGTQQGLLLSPQTIREFLVPEYRRLFDFYKRRGVLVNFHSCGHIEPLIDLFLELGVDILNPVQATANDLDAIRRATQGRIALQGGIDSALVVSGPVEAIREEVRRRIAQLGLDGGYFCRPDQGMPWPGGHIRALEEAVDEFGSYPLATNDTV